LRQDGRSTRAIGDGKGPASRLSFLQAQVTLLDQQQATRLRSDGNRRQIAPGGSIEPDGSRLADTYVIESGLVAVSLSVKQTPQTCVGLLSAGSLFSFCPTVGDGPPSYRAVGPVTVSLIPVQLLRDAMLRQPAVRNAFLDQLRQRLAQVELFAACNAHHTLAQRCARWLMRFSQCTGEVIPVTHGFLAEMLGVRRAGVSVTLQALQLGGAIRQRRGSIVVIDAGKLAACACPCPNSLISPDDDLSVEAIRRGAVVNEGPRMWIEREIRAQVPASATDEGYRRRAAALRVCQSIIAQGSTFLEAQ
jgi:CRP-like cAMP-binding protein